MFKPKTFNVAGPNGATPAEQLATFAHYIQGAQFRFVVTRVIGQNIVKVTHRHSGKAVCEVTHASVAAALRDYAVAGKSALVSFIETKGEARVASVLRAAEAEPAFSHRAA